MAGPESSDAAGAKRAEQERIARLCLEQNLKPTRTDDKLTAPVWKSSLLYKSRTASSAQRRAARSG